MKCMYSISPPVCSFYATIISRLAINTFCYDEWMNFDTVKSMQPGSVTCDSVQAHWHASASCCSYNISPSFRRRCWIIALSNFQGLIKVQGLTGRAWDEFHCLRGKLRCGFELREWTIPKEVVYKVTHTKISIYKRISIQKGKDGKKWMPICGMLVILMYECTSFKKLEDSITGLWLFHWPLSWFLRIILLTI